MATRSVMGMVLDIKAENDEVVRVRSNDHIEESRDVEDLRTTTARCVLRGHKQWVSGKKGPKQVVLEGDGRLEQPKEMVDFNNLEQGGRVYRAAEAVAITLLRLKKGESVTFNSEYFEKLSIRWEVGKDTTPESQDFTRRFVSLIQKIVFETYFLQGRTAPVMSFIVEDERLVVTF